VRVFVDDDVIHVDGRIDPASDVATIETELILADLQTVERSSPRLEREAKRGGGDAHSRSLKPRRPKARSIRPRHLQGEGPRPRRAGRHASSDDKPFIYVFNVDEGDLGDEARRAALAASVAPSPSVILCAKVEAELSRPGRG